MTPLETILALGPQRLFLLTILIIFAQPVLQNRLEAVTGWAPNTIKKHLAALQELRLTARDGHRGGWQATITARQMILGEPSLTEGSMSDKRELSTENSNLSTELFSEPSTVEGSNAPSSSSRSMNQKNKDLPLPLLSAEPSIVEGSDSADVAKLLAAAGCWADRAARIAALPYANLSYVVAHLCDGAESDLTLTLWRIENNRPPTKKALRHAASLCQPQTKIIWACSKCDEGYESIAEMEGNELACDECGGTIQRQGEETGADISNIIFALTEGRGYI